MNPLPTGTLTFLFTDIEGSTELWERAPEAMGPAMARHDALFEGLVETHSGYNVRPRGEGDSRFAVFPDAVDAIAAAVAVQRAIAAEPWETPEPMRLRMGLHTGVADLRSGDYYGSVVNRCARLRGLGYGGQVLLSLTTRELVADALPVGVSLEDMGYHTLKGLARPENVFQLLIPGLPAEFPPLKSLQNLPNNLPAQTTPFFGREQEVAELIRRLGDPGLRVLTLTGPGGAGKTRLSLEAAAELLERYSDGVFFIPLAPISDPALVPATIAQTLGVREGGGLPPLENLKTYLRDKQILLVLDNFEQVSEAAAGVADLLAAAAGLKFMVSSRIPLRIRGEYELPIPPLAVPEGTPPLEELAAIPGVQLFVDRAAAANPRFKLTDENAGAVAAICRRLDGLPLALEIAAARTRLLPPQAMLKRLDQSLKLLTRGARDLPTRQQTLRGAIDWSYDLLTPEERNLFAHLSVFVGGFNLEAAEVVCGGEGNLDVFEGVATLLENSLLRQVGDPEAEPRFEMLQTIREYALEKLTGSADLEVVQAAHANYFFNRSQELFPDLYSNRSADALAAIEHDHDNFRAVLNWSLMAPDRLGVGLQIVFTIFWFWYRHGHFREGREWTERFLAQTEGMGRNLLRGLALGAASGMAMWEGDLNRAHENGREGLMISSAMEDPEGMANATMFLGIVLINQGRDTEARPLLEESVEIFQELGQEWFATTGIVHLANAALGLGDTDAAEAWLEKAVPIARRIGDPWQIAFAVNNQGEVARVRGDYAAARRYYEETAEQYRIADAVGDQARLIHNLGYIAQYEGDLVEAESQFRESLVRFQELGNKRGIAECLAGLAGLAANRGYAEWAAPLLSAAETSLSDWGAAWWPADRVEVERARETLRGALGEGLFARLWGQGQRMGLEEAIAYGSGGPGSIPTNELKPIQPPLDG